MDVPLSVEVAVSLLIPTDRMLLPGAQMSVQVP